MKKLAIVVACALLMTALTASARQGGGGGGGGSHTDTIRVSKCYYAIVGYVELLIKANSSDPTAHLYAYLPSGAYLGELQNGGGSRYGGDTFVTLTLPATITILS